MGSRKEKILERIILEYVKNAQPVGSLLLSEEFDVSPATIRNDMAILAKEGYICQPHISAGRVPTEQGYQHYINCFLRPVGLPEEHCLVLKSLLDQIQGPEDVDSMIKEMARVMSGFSVQTVIVAFQYNDVFYTGISNLFTKPEFADLQTISHLSGVLDDLNQAVYEIFDQVGHNVEVFLGSNNPFGTQCSTLVTRYQHPLNNGRECLLGILGPMRMPYDYNISLLEYCRDMIMGNVRKNFV